MFTGIGTSLHACRVAAAWTRLLSGGRVRAHAIDAHDLALGNQITSADQVVVVSHRGTKQRPNEVLRKAREVGAFSIAVTGEGPAQPDADVVLRTVPQEQASTHTVSYLGALTVLARLVHGLLGADGDPLAAALRDVPDALRRTLDMPLSDAAVDALTESTAPGLIAGSDLDAITAQEAALKLKEGTYRWVEAMSSEFALHGTPAVFGPSTFAYLLKPVHDDWGRTRQLGGLLTALGARVIVAGEPGEGVDLPFAGLAGRYLARPLVAIMPFQRLVSAAAAVLGASPDLTHLEAEPWTSAINAVEL